MECRKCFNELQVCPGCHGVPPHGRTCVTCINSGAVCPKHGAFHGHQTPPPDAAGRLSSLLLCELPPVRQVPINAARSHGPSSFM
ncbi:hypothetical protein GCM10027026_00030 [Myroides odoratimimus subsp. xuanwuensis]